MATYNNQHWLLSHIRNSFISTDDTGMCETVMLSEDLPNQYAQNLNRSENLFCYPGLDQSDEEPDMDILSQSYEILMEPEMGLHRQRSNTAQKLEKMEMARRRAAKIKSIKFEDNNINAPLTSDDIMAMFPRKIRENLIIDTNKPPNKSLLTDAILKCPKQPQNKYAKYAQFDGTSQTKIPTRSIKIFISVLPPNLRNYPMTVCVSASATIQEFIGLICYKCSIAHPDIPLLSVHRYGLYITEEDGEVDQDFPPLDLTEPCGKFRFGYLALLERHKSDCSDSLIHLSEPISLPASLPHQSYGAKALRTQHSEDMARMMGHTSMIEAPLYRTYNLHLLFRGIFKTEVQLGISGEKIEIDPVQASSSFSFVFARPKAMHHGIDLIAGASFESHQRRTGKSTFRLVYAVQALATTFTEDDDGSSEVEFRAHMFEAKNDMAKEIIDKVQNILKIYPNRVTRLYQVQSSLMPRKKGQF